MDWTLKAGSSSRAVLFSLLAGFAFSSFLPILLNAPFLSQLAMLFLAPAGIALSFFSHTLMPSPISLILVNTACYAVCIRALLGRAQITWFRISIFAVIAAALFLVDCVPRFDPLWPHGMAELATRKTAIKKILFSDRTVAQVRQELERQSIPITEEIESSSRTVLTYGQTQITAAAGDTVLSGRIHTDAAQYPCTYDLQVLAVYGADGRPKSLFVQSMPVCP